MIIIRRLLAVPFLLVFFVVFLVLAILMTCYRASNPSLYASHLEEEGFYQLIHEKIPLLVRTASKEEEVDREIEQITIAIAQDVASAEWMQQASEECLEKMIPFLFAQTDEFRVKIPLEDRFTALHKSIQKNILDEQRFEALYPRLITDSSESYTKKLIERNAEHIFLHPNRQSLRQEIEEILREAYPPAELRALLDNYVTQIIAFFKGEQKECILTYDIAKPIIIALDKMERRLEKSETYKRILREDILSWLAKQELPFGVELNEEDTDVLFEAITFAWLKSESKGQLRKLQDFFAGRTNGFSIDFTRYEQKFIEALSTVANDKLKSKWQSLPEGEPDESGELLKMIYQGKVPPRRPYNLSYEEMLAQASIDIGEIVETEYRRHTTKLPVLTDVEVYERIAALERTEGIISWVENQHLRTLQINFHVSFEKINVNRDDEKVVYLDHHIQFTQDIFAKRDSKEVEEVREAMRMIPTIFFTTAGVAFVLLVMLALLCAKKMSHATIWAAGILLTATLISTILLIFFERAAWPLLTAEIVAEIDGNPNIMDKTGAEIGYRALTALKQAMITPISSFLLIIGAFSSMLIFVKWLFRSQAQRHEFYTGSTL